MCRGWRQWGLCGLLALAASVWAQPATVASADRQWSLRVQAAAGTPAARPALQMLDAAQDVVREYPLASLDGQRLGEVRQILDMPLRRSFVVSFYGLPELWEVSYDPKASPIHDGLVHDYRMGEALGQPGFLGVRRTPLPEPVQIAQVEPDGRHVLLQRDSPQAETAELRYLRVHLDARTVVSRFNGPRTSPGDARQ